MSPPGPGSASRGLPECEASLLPPLLSRRRRGAQRPAEHPKMRFFPLFLPRDPPPPAPRFRDGETEGQRGGATCPPRSPPGDRVQSAPVQSRTLLSHSPHATSSSWLGGTCRLLTSLCLVPSSPLGAPGIPASGPAPPDGHRAGPQLRDPEPTEDGREELT